MSRKPSDAFTRFTQTSPHASRPTATRSPQSQPPLQHAQSSPSSSIPNETASERVARLRAAHRQQRTDLQLSTLDRLIYRGRLWADTAHRITAYLLIGATGVAAVGGAAALVSLIAHNRRQKRGWIEREMARLDAARMAFLDGSASAEQLHLLEQERAGDEMKARREAEKNGSKKEGGIFAKAKAFVVGSAATGDLGREEDVLQQQQQQSTLSSTASDGSSSSSEQQWNINPTQAQTTTRTSRTDSERAVASGVHGVGLDGKGRPVPMDRAVREYELRQQQGSSRNPGENDGANSPPRAIRGGPLDVMAGNIAGTLTRSSGNGGGDWLSWLRGSGSNSRA